MNLRSVIFALIFIGCGVDPKDGLKQSSNQDLDQEDLPVDSSAPLDGNTWIIGRPSFEPFLLTASKSGRELITSDHWQDEDSILQTESLSTLDEQDPNSTPPPVGLGPHLLAQSFESQPLSIELVEFKPGIDAKKILERWQQQGRILYYEPNTISEPKASAFQDLSNQYTDAKVEWHKAIRLPEAFLALADGTIPHENEDVIFGRAPVIAVIDSGVDIKHPYLEKAIWQNPFPGLQCKDDSRGCNTSTNFSKDYLGNGEIWPVGLEGFGQACTDGGQCIHGTHVSGIIAAYDKEHPIGVCPFCKILPIKVSRPKSASEPGGISDSSIIRALQYLTQFSRDGQSLIRIANASFGKYQRSRSVASLVRKLGNAAGGGTLLIAAASNEDSSQRAYPASISEVISVSALDENLKKASFSNYGPSVDIAAPGTKINSTVPGPGGETKDEYGTSMATPVVAGVAGLILALNPSMDAKTLRNRLIQTANPYIYANEVEGGYNSTYYYPKVSTGERIPLLGSGIVDALAALKGDSQNVPNPSNKNRVTPGCSALSSDNLSFNYLYFLMFLPIFVLLTKRVFKSFAR
ncbi:MAG: S8 family serine peptidase [Pseudomonadota bacterium]